MSQAPLRSIQVLREETLRGDASPLFVPRRRIAAVVYLADGSKLAGDLYAAVHNVPAKSEPLLDRLNDPEERYVPLAHDDRHVLLNKSAVVSVELARVETPGEFDPANASPSFRVELTLDSGRTVRGVVHPHAHATAPHYRALDLLNTSGRGFLRLVRGSRAVYVNHDHVVAVREIVER